MLKVQLLRRISGTVPSPVLSLRDIGGLGIAAKAFFLPQYGELGDAETHEPGRCRFVA